MSQSKFPPFYVFLDVDGVLNNMHTFNKSPHGFTGIDDENLRILGDILAEIDAHQPVDNPCQIILSSSWKVNWRLQKGHPNKDATYLNKALRYINHPIKDYTQDYPDRPFYEISGRRGYGIRMFLEKHPYTNYLVLDDETFEFKAEDVWDHVLQTDWRTGLSEVDYEAVITFLNGNPIPRKKDIVYTGHFGRAITEMEKY